MKNQENNPHVEKGKAISILILFITSILIILSGTSFGVFSLITNASFTVFNSQIHGSIFGMVVTFLGMRYFLSVRKLQAEVYKTTSRFSWNNFKKVDN